MKYLEVLGLLSIAVLSSCTILASITGAIQQIVFLNDWMKGTLILVLGLPTSVTILIATKNYMLGVE